MSAENVWAVPERLDIPGIREVLAQARQAIAARRLQFDFAAVRQVDSSALALILACQREAGRAGGQLVCLNLPDNLHSLARLYGVDALIDGKGQSA